MPWPCTKLLCYVSTVVVLVFFSSLLHIWLRDHTTLATFMFRFQLHSAHCLALETPS